MWVVLGGGEGQEGLPRELTYLGRKGRGRGRGREGGREGRKGEREGREGRERWKGEREGRDGRERGHMLMRADCVQF